VPVVQQKNGNMRINGKEVNNVNTKNLELNKVVNGVEGDGTTFVMNTSSIEDLSKQEAISKYNDQVSNYIDKLDKHANLLDQYSKEISKDLNRLEIKPLYEGILIKPYAENPFQQIKKEGAIIVDLGGQKPVYKSHEDGEFHEEESFIHVGLVIEIGPTCKFIKEGDVVMWRKVSETPVPFFKQGLVLVNEHSILTTVNKELDLRFAQCKIEK
jgi:hypothetical protein